MHRYLIRGKSLRRPNAKPIPIGKEMITPYTVSIIVSSKPLHVLGLVGSNSHEVVAGCNPTPEKKITAMMSPAMKNGMRTARGGLSVSASGVLSDVPRSAEISKGMKPSQ